MSLIHFIRVLLKRKKLLLVIPLIAVLAGVFFLRKMPDEYRSEAVLSAGIVDDTKIKLEEDKSEASAFVIQTKFSNIIELIKGKAVIDLVSYSLLLHDLKSEVPFRNPAIYSSISGQQKDKMVRILQAYIGSLEQFKFYDPAEREMKQLIYRQKYNYEEIMKQLKIDRVDFSDFIHLEYRSENSELSPFVLNKLCEIFSGFYANTMNKKTGYSVDFFRKMAEEKKKELNDLVEQLKTYKLNNKIINLYEQTKSVVNQISELEIHREDLNKQIPSLTEALKNINSRFSAGEQKYLEVKFAPSQGKISDYKEKINDIQNRIIAGNTSKMLSDSLSELKKQLKISVHNLSDEMIINPEEPRQELVRKKIDYEIDLDMAVQGIKSNDKELKRLYKIVEDFTPSEAAISSYEREINVAAQSYLVILNKLNLAKFSSEDAGKNIQQTEYAVPAEKPEANKKSVLIILMGAIGFLLTIVIIFVLEYIDLTIQSPSRFRKFAGLEPVATINEITDNKLDIVSLPDSRNQSLSLNVYFKAIRTLRNRIVDLAGIKKVIAFTSFNNGAGKTLIVTTLAFALKKAGYRVLIMDLNSKSNMLTKNFGVQSRIDSPGSFTLIPDSAGMEGIDIVGINDSVLSLGEMLSVSQLKQFLSRVITDYDFVLIETSSINKYSDTYEIASVVEGLICVQPANRVLEQADKKSLEIIVKNEKFMGCVLNRVDMEYMEEIMGELPNKRNYLRSKIKKLFKRELHGNSSKPVTINIGVKE